ncbi:hypothetical protein IPG41_00480 [Candidatus Peregrinibacteria bacterium]|nr:MAG: hypothetical protein IPG41_00480 [Candidatus Peregrinibacteria bacterium]
MKKIFAIVVILGLLLSLFVPPVRADEAEGVSTQTLTGIVEQNTLLLQLKQKVAQIQYRYTLLEENLETAQKTWRKPLNPSPIWKKF